MLDCPKCGTAGVVKLSQANGQAYHDGDQDVRVELVPDGFRVVMTEFGSNFYCATCGASADHKRSHPSEHDTTDERGPPTEAKSGEGDAGPLTPTGTASPQDRSVICCGDYNPQIAWQIDIYQFFAN